MWDAYYYKKAIRRPRYAKYRTRLYIGIIFIVLLVAAAVYVWLDLRTNKPQPSAFSKVQSVVVGNQLNTFKSPYFTFQDTGKWDLDSQSTPSKFIYTKFLNLVPQYQLTIYVNEVPIPLDLATNRSVPVRIVNGDSFDVTTVSYDCSRYIDSANAARLQQVTVNGAGMLCDPDSSQYKVQVSQVTGDYRLPLHRADGTPLQLIIIYYDETGAGDPNKLISLLNTFKTR